LNILWSGFVDDGVGSQHCDELNFSRHARGKRVVYSALILERKHQIAS
jgi:hypothetical protein